MHENGVEKEERVKQSGFFERFFFIRTVFCNIVN